MKTFISSLEHRISQKINFVNETTSNYSLSRFASSFTKNETTPNYSLSRFASSFTKNETTPNYSLSRFASSLTKNDHNLSKELTIDSTLVKRLLADQFPQFKDLPVRQVHPSGWDNRTFHLGDDMLVRMPSAERYAAQVEKEQEWLPRLAPLLPVPIPKPLAMGNSYPLYK